MGILAQDIQGLRETFAYDPETGQVRFLRSARRGWAGRVAGSAKDGYLETNYAGRNVRIHHVAWALMTGEWPPIGVDIDHINGARSDNRWANLRLATRAQNCVNRGAARKDSATGVRGVKYDAGRRKFIAIIRADGRNKRLGRFATLEQAQAVRVAAEKQFYGEFAPCRS